MSQPFRGRPGPTGPLAHPLLWSAEKDGRTTYLFGTMHTRRRRSGPACRAGRVGQASTAARRVPRWRTDLDDPARRRCGAVRPAGSAARTPLRRTRYWHKLEGRASGGPIAAAPSIEHLAADDPRGGAGRCAACHRPPQDGPRAVGGARAGEHKGRSCSSSRRAGQHRPCSPRWIDLKGAQDDARRACRSGEQHRRRRRCSPRTSPATSRTNRRAPRRTRERTDGASATAYIHKPAAEYDPRDGRPAVRPQRVVDRGDRADPRRPGGGFVAVGGASTWSARAAVLDLLARRGYRREPGSRPGAGKLNGARR